jgi:tRNA threonylcarbamoyl adenosine modification protein YeaZ
VTLAIDSGSPLLSIAVASPEGLLAAATSEATRSSAALMGLLDDCLQRADLTPRELDRLLVLHGPGRFTGLRVGLAVAQGFRQALGLRTGTLSTLEVLAACAEGTDSPVLAMVRTGRDHWAVQEFEEQRSTPVGLPRSYDLEELAQRAPLPLIGFDLDALPEDPFGEWIQLEPSPLAPVALAISERADWRGRHLSTPLYLAPPPADPAARRRG